MTRFIALVSGKGGVGKTTSTLNIGQALTEMDKKTVVVDGNLVTPNLSIHLGQLNPTNTLNKFLRKKNNLKEITYAHQSGLSFIPSSPSYTEFQQTNAGGLTELFEHLDDNHDFVLIDAPSGLGFELNQVLKNSDEALLVVTPSLSSMVDALKTIEVAKSYNNIIGGIILNMTHRGRNELKPEQVEEILGHKIIANVRNDRKVRKSLHKQAPLNYLYPHSRSARQFAKVAEHLCFEQ